MQGLSITVIIIILTTGASFYAWSNPVLFQRWLMMPYRVTQHKEYYRMVTSGLIHKDHLHLIFNMFSFYFFGSAVEVIFKYLFGEWSALYFVGLYVSAIVVSDLTTLIKHRSNVSYASLGASGGVAAVIFAFILFLPTEDICLYAVLCLPGFLLGLIYLIYSYYSGKRAGDSINHDAHLMGAVYGLVFCIVLVPQSIGRFIEQIANWKLF
jgi:membrane associated rhomboid family serine protease